MKAETIDEQLDLILHSFERYYTIKKDDVIPPFVAEADFVSHNEQYFLVKSAKIADIDSNEFVFFAQTDFLDMENFLEYDKAAWATGLSRIVPYSGHRNSDITLVIIADKINDEVKKIIKKTKHYKSYKFSFWGWSNFKLVTMEFSSGQLFSNRMGGDLKKLFSK